MSIHLITTQKQLEELIPVVMSKPAWGFDTETSGLDPFLNRVTLMQIGDTEEQYVIDTRKVLIEPLRPFLESEHILKIGHNLKFDYKMVKGTFGIGMEGVRCTYLMEQIINNGLKFSGFGLDDVLEQYLKVIIPGKKEMQKSFINHVGDYSPEQIKYAATDVQYMLPLFSHMAALADEENLTYICLLESGAIPAFGDMELHGIPLNQEEWLKISEKNLIMAGEVVEKMNEFTSSINWPCDIFGNPLINYSSPTQVVDLLNRLELKIDGKPIEKSDDKTLKKLQKYPIVKLIQQYRGLMVRYGTFGMPFIKAIHPSTGRIHMDLEQIGTETGRVASGYSPVNMLNIPRDNRMRNCFYAPEDTVIETDDYSGCELRIWAHISQDPELCKALREGIDLHCYVASKLYGVTVTKTENKHLRTPAKTLNFGRPEGCTSCA